MRSFLQARSLEAVHFLCSSVVTILVNRSSLADILSFLGPIPAVVLTFRPPGAFHSLCVLHGEHYASVTVIYCA